MHTLTIVLAVWVLVAVVVSLGLCALAGRNRTVGGTRL